MRYINNHKYCIEEKARRMFGETDIFEFAGYILTDGTMLNFSYEGYQRDEDHRVVGQFFEKATQTEAVLKFMRRGNIRVMCNDTGYRFEYIKPLTKEQMCRIREAFKTAEEFGIEFMLERDDAKGKAVKVFYDMYEYDYAA